MNYTPDEFRSTMNEQTLNSISTLVAFVLWRVEIGRVDLNSFIFDDLSSVNNTAGAKRISPHGSE
jgi:hypothetical protein